MKSFRVLAAVAGAWILLGIIVGRGFFYHSPGEAILRHTPRAWQTHHIECPTPEKFFVNYLAAIGTVPERSFPDIIISMYMIYYTARRIDGNDNPFDFEDDSDDDSYSSMLEVLTQAMLPIYKVCLKEKFSFSKLAGIEKSIRNEYKEYYHEFLSRYHKELFNALHDFPE